MACCSSESRSAGVLRSFLAATVSAPVRETYASVIAEARTRFGALRWVAPENLHLTLRFLGDATTEAREKFVAGVTPVAATIPPFEIELGCPGHFGRRRTPRALWFSVGRGLESLRRVADAAEEAARAAGFKAEKRSWSAHFTVARNPRSRAVDGWYEFLAAGPLAGLCWLLEDITLYASCPQKQGQNVYTSLRSIKLGPEPVS